MFEPQSAWTVHIEAGPVSALEKKQLAYLWPVRGVLTSGTPLLPKTGQNTCFDTDGTAVYCSGTGQDGETRTGVAWPQPRFTINGDQTVSDRLTGLIWASDGGMASSVSLGINVDGRVSWQGALDYLATLNEVGYLGYRDWRLPNRLEMASIINHAESDPAAWLASQGISNVQQEYWSSGTLPSLAENGWKVDISGRIGSFDKNQRGGYVWPVRGGRAVLVSGIEPLSAQSLLTTATQSNTAAVMAATTTLSVVTSSLPAGTVGSAYNQTLAATGGTTPYTWSIAAGSLPSGLSLSSTGVISGTPTVAGTSSFTVQVKDKSRVIATKALSITTNPAPLSITIFSLVDGSTNTSYSQTLAASGGVAPYTWSVTSGALPAGLTLSIAGVISGTPTTVATSTFTVQAKDAVATTTSKSLSITITIAPLGISTTSLPAGTTETFYSQTLTATGGVTPYTWTKTAGSLPVGLSINEATGVISGTSYAAGTSNFTVQVKDAVGTTTIKSLSLTINIAPLTILSNPIINGYIGINWTSGLDASGGTKPYSWTVKQGSLPPGITLDSSFGSFTDAPTQVGTYSYTIQVKDANNKTASKAFTSTISVNGTIISTATLADGNDTVSYSQALTADGGTPPYNWRHLSGDMPDGLSLNGATGVISGTPRGTGTSTVTIQTNDAYGGPATKTFSINIKNAPLSIDTPVLPYAYVTAPYIYNQSLSARGGFPPYSGWTITGGSLPPGLSLDAATGVINGRPTISGDYPFTVQVRDSNNATTGKSLDLHVEAVSVLNEVYPIPDAINVAPTAVTAAFSDSMNPDTITKGSFTVRRTEKITGISAGDTHTLALKSDGTVAAWGDNWAAQAGVPPELSDVVAISAGAAYSLALKNDGTVVAWGTYYSGSAYVPAGLSGVKAVAAGDSHSVALKDDGTVVVWGDNSYGQCTVPAELSGVIAVGAGYAHTIALRNDGTVIAWGLNNYNQTAVPAGLSGVVAIAAGRFHTVALKNDGSVVAWGDNTKGQITIPPGLNGVSAIAAGGRHTLALEANGIVVAWGESYSDGHASVPVELSGVVEIAAGVIHDVARKSDGTVAVWSLKVPKTVADGKVMAWECNDYNQATVPVDLNGVMAVASGSYHTVALKGDGTISAWGLNDDDQTIMPAGLTGVVAVSASGRHAIALKSDGTVVDLDRNPPDFPVPAGLSGVIAISAGEAHSLALKNDGTAVAWGDSDFDKTTVPAGLSGVAAIAAGGDGTNAYYGITGHSVALKADGSVVAWGYNEYGQTTVPTGLSDAIAIAAGWNHSVALRNNGTVVAWGDNIKGQATVPAGLSGVIAIAAGGNHTVALKGDGTVVVWGENYSGQTNVPPELSGVVAISAGAYNTLAVKADGTMVGWGYNAYGQSVAPISPYETPISGSVS